jgi:hypothetical protein
MSNSNISDTIGIAVNTGWIQLAIDKFEAGGGVLSSDETAVLSAMTNEELISIAKVEERIRGGMPGAAGVDGVAF